MLLTYDTSVSIVWCTDNMRLREFQIPKNSWELVVNDTDKTEIGHDLVKLVQTAYSSTVKGSFVNSVKDVLPSDWQIFDWDEDPGPDVAIFYRQARANEPWSGYKVQGIGHDGKPQSKQKAIAQVTKLISQSGWWMESSSAMRLAMKGMNAPACADERILSKLFPGSFIRMIDRETYIRKIDGMVMQETVFGNPVLKGMNESINPQVFRRGFEKTKEILNGKYMLKAYHGALPYSPTKKIHQSENFHIDAFTAKGSKVGGVTYKVTDDSLEAVFVEVKPEYRRQGVAKEMYIFAKELGNEIIPSTMRIYNGNDFGKGITDLYKQTNEDEYADDDEDESLKSINDIKRLLPTITAAVQKEYDRWDENPDEYANGGICHLLADEVCSVLWDHNIQSATVSSDHEVHVYTIAKVREGVWSVDIPPGVYETGGGYNWKKIHDVQFDPRDIDLYCITRDPTEFNDITGYEE